MLTEAFAMAAQATPPLSGVSGSLLLGMVVANATPGALRGAEEAGAGLAKRFSAGIGFGKTQVLRAGIVLLGLKLSMLDVMTLSVSALPIVAGTVGSGLLLTTLICRRLGLGSDLGLLLAGGTSICGVTAITALAPTIKASPQDVSVAVANVTAFGLLSMTLWPYLVDGVFHTPEQVGLFLGTAIHDTSQVMAAGMQYALLAGNDAAMQVAAVTKLCRNSFLALVLPALAFAKFRAESAATGPTAIPWKTIFPLFILGFLATAAIRSLGDAYFKQHPHGKLLGVAGLAEWKQAISFLGSQLGSQACLGVAMAAVGLSTDWKSFRGVKPAVFLAGFLAAASLSLTSFLLVKYLKPNPSAAASMTTSH